MAQSITRERTFDAACSWLGKVGQAVGFKAAAPVVIIGTGRTGTNLLESILRTHPRIAMFPGEANELWHPLLEPFDSSTIDLPPIEIDPRRFSKVSVANWPVRHVDAIRDVFAGFQVMAGRAKVLVTKSAMISFMIPQILAVWPEARFIHQYRFGLAVVDSYFKKNHGKYAHYSYSERDYRLYCARYWNACILEIDQQKHELSLDKSGRLFELGYETLCEDPGSTLGRLAVFLGVKAEDFAIDLSIVTSQNFKTADLKTRPEGQELLDIMSPGLTLKGYTAVGAPS